MVEIERDFERQANIWRGVEPLFTYSIVFTDMKVMFVSHFFKTIFDRTIIEFGFS